MVTQHQIFNEPKARKKIWTYIRPQRTWGPKTDMNLRAENFYEHKTQKHMNPRAQDVFLRTHKKLWTQGPQNSTHRRRIT